MSEQIEGINTNTEAPSLYDFYALLQSYKICNIDFAQFVRCSKYLAVQVLAAKKQNKTTSTEK